MDTANYLHESWRTFRVRTILVYRKIGARRVTAIKRNQGFGQRAGKFYAIVEPFSVCAYGEGATYISNAWIRVTISAEALKDAAAGFAIGFCGIRRACNGIFFYK